jgi:hypothetical protein
MRELQKISAKTLQTLPHTVPIKSGSETVALLVPIRRVSPEQVASVLARIDAAAAARSPEQNILIDELLAENEGGPDQD